MAATRALFDTIVAQQRVNMTGGALGSYRLVGLSYRPLRQWRSRLLLSAEAQIIPAS